MLLKWHPDEAIAQHTRWPLPGSIYIHRLKHQRIGGKLIRISMITTPTQWRLAEHFGDRTLPTGGDNKSKHTPSTLVSPMWCATYSLSYHMVSESRPVFPWAMMSSAGGSPQPQVRPLAKQLFVRQFARANNVILPGDDPTWDMTNTENNSEMETEAEERKLHIMAKVHDLMEMWQGSQNLHPTQKESSDQNKQMTPVGYISDTEGIVIPAWSLFHHEGAAAFKLSVRSL